MIFRVFLAVVWTIAAVVFLFDPTGWVGGWGGYLSVAGAYSVTILSVLAPDEQHTLIGR